MTTIQRAVTTVASLSFLTLVTLSCTGESPKQLASNFIPVDKVEDPKNEIDFRPKVDILFVIDNSGSMEGPQQNLISNIGRFVDAIAQIRFLDFHIGVITGDMSTRPPECCGYLRGFPSYVTPTTPDLTRVLSRNLDVGTDGSGYEIFFDPAIAALSAPLENSENAGFYRPDAYLAVIIITDTADQGEYSSKEFYDFLIQKKGMAKKLLGYGVLVKTWELDKCQSDDQTPDTKIEDFLRMVANTDPNDSNILSLCAVDYGDKLAEFSRDIVRHSIQVAYLNRIPIVKTIQVKYGTQVIPNDAMKGWTYDPALNAVRLGRDIEIDDQPTGTKLTILFDSYQD